MLLHTHTWILREYLRTYRPEVEPAPDAYVYNVIPDILPIHESITSRMTHAIPRVPAPPRRFAKLAYAQFHLMVDDMAHCGKISPAGFDAFDPSPGGYAYLKGRQLIPAIKAFHGQLGDPLGDDEAIYRSHMVIEMAFDLVLFEREGSLLELFSGALEYTLRKRRRELVDSVRWLLGVPGKTAEAAVEQGFRYYGGERIYRTLSLEGRAGLYIGKFGLDTSGEATRPGVRDLIGRGMNLCGDYERFLGQSLKAIRETGFDPPS